MIRIAHLSDNQIRNFKRHKEFRQSFEYLYESLKEKQPDCIVHVGDLAHTKTQISPEFVDLCAEYLTRLASIAPLVLIPGNHDGNVANLSRMDALTPIVKALDNSNIHYYKKSGIYTHVIRDVGYYEGFMLQERCNFVVFSCFDNNWPTKTYENEGINIGLYHGFVRGAILQNGMKVTDDIPVANFLKLVDFLMLGDIHRMQILDHEYRAAYCGSYPQQNYGENTSKGYLFWKIESKDKHEVDFIELPNVCPYYTIMLEEDLKLKKYNFQQKARIRVLSRQITHSEKESLKAKIRKKYNPVELKFLDELNPHRQEIKIKSVSAKIENLSDVAIQEKLIKGFLKKFKVEKKILEKVLGLNNNYDSVLRKEEDIIRNIQYRLGKLKWSNTFSFGENNVFDFSEHKGLLGVFGKNAQGKSSAVVDTPLYCLFNKNSKGIVKNDLIINENKDLCSAEIEVHVGKDVHKIYRQTGVYVKSGKRKGSPILQGRTDVDYKIVRGSKVENGNGLERSDTDANIRKVFGSPEDFMLTATAPQWQLLNFINLGGSERQRLIGRYFDIDIFAKKCEVARKDFRDIKSKISALELTDFKQERKELETKLKEIVKKIDETKKIQKKSEGIKKETEEEIAEFLRQIVPIKVSRKDYIAAKEKEIKIREKLFEELHEIEDILGDYTLESLHKEEALALDHKETVKQLKTHKCISPESCCLRKKVESIKVRKIAEIQKDIKLFDQIQKLEEKLDKQANKIHDLEKLQEIKEKEIEQIEKNEKLQNEIDKLNALKHATSVSLEEVAEMLLECFAEKKACEDRLVYINSSEAKYEALRDDCDALDYFIRAISKDGIPKEIIADNLDVVNGEINKILSKGVNFGIELESMEDGKKIEVFFKHERSPRRQIELCSGMEKVFAAVAIRAALVSITTLPKSNLFILDEIFPSLDPEYVDAVTKILEYLKQLFDCVIIVTHIDSFKDIVDHVVEVERDEDGYSRVI